MTDPRLGIPDPGAVADVLAVQDVLHAYADGVDGHDWELARSVFTEDAHLDYSASGGPAGPADTVIDWIAGMLTALGQSQHIMANTRVRVDGDLAHSVTQLLNPLLLGQGTEETAAVLVGGRYVDRLRRVAGAWRIEHRVQSIDLSATLRARASAEVPRRPWPGEAPS